MDFNETLVVLSHLRWNFVFQRPQHLMTRFSQQRRVLFIEEPVYEDLDTPRWDREEVSPSLTVCRLHTRLTDPGFNAEQLEILRPMLRELLKQEGSQDYILWFYSPLALPVADDLTPRAIVYDCMDELSAFLNAPPEMLAREQELLDLADVVFTGGPSLYEAKRHRHANVHCFSSSVDVTHFASAVAATEPADVATISHPRLGYIGVIDERLDVSLLDAVSQARPDWQFVMIGPVVKIDPSVLPRRENVHYLGGRKYAELPGYLAGWDVCLMPFARNEATRHISPTKVLEYMAADKPIVSTSIADVANVYQEIIYLGDSPEEFLQACEWALNAPSDERQLRSELAQQVLARTSWDRTALEMNRLMEAAVHARKAKLASSPSLDEKTVPGERSKPGHPMSDFQADLRHPTIVIGAGPTGLSAGYHLGEDSLIFESNATVGGWCRSVVKDGFTFDFAGHIMFSNDPYVQELYQLLLGENVHWQDREAWIYSKSVHTRYPFQGSLYGLPAEVIKECLLGAIEARFGTSDRSTPEKPAATASMNGTSSSHQPHNGFSGNGHIASTNGEGAPSPVSVRHGAKVGHSSMTAARRTRDAAQLLQTSHGNTNGKCSTNGHTNGEVQDCCGDGILESAVRLQKLVDPEKTGNKVPQAPQPPANFEEFIYQVWGAGIARHFAIPYNKKLWAVPLQEMETSWLGGRVPMPDLGEMIEGALKPSPRPMGPNARFGYPLRGGFQALMDAFVPLLTSELRLNSRVTEVDAEQHLVTLSDGLSYRYDHLISTMPLPLLIKALGTAVPEEIRRAAAQLRYVSVRCVHIGVGQEALTNKHWIYYPEDTVFHRIFVQGNASPHCNPHGGFGLTCEITYSPYKPLPCEGDELIQRCIRECIEVGMIPADAPIWTALECDLPHAYVVYDHARASVVTQIREWLAGYDIILAGRYSEWEYYNSDHAFLAGKKAAETVRERQSQFHNLQRNPQDAAATV